MAKWSGIVLLLVLLLLCCNGVVFAQEEEMRTMSEGYTMLKEIIWTLMWSLAYLPIYAGGLIIPMYYLQRFSGVDSELLFLIAVLWLGGMGANYVGYALPGHHRWLILLVAAVLIFGWCILICTRSWADLSLKESLIVGVVIMVLCTPYFGPTWRISRPKPPEEESRTHLYQQVTVAGSYARPSPPGSIGVMLRLSGPVARRLKSGLRGRLSWPSEGHAAGRPSAGTQREDGHFMLML